MPRTTPRSEIVGTLACPNCGREDIPVRYYENADRKYYCRLGVGGCGAHGWAKQLEDGTFTALRTPRELQCARCRATFHTANINRIRRKDPLCDNCSGRNPDRKRMRLPYTPITIRRCEHCNEWFVRPRRLNRREQRFCGIPCSQEHARAQAARRRSAPKRKFQQHRNAKLAIAYAYGYKCHLCRKLIDVSLLDSHPMGLTIDHLIPRCDGGTDDPTNLAPAHHSCNSRRTDTGPAQLQAFGAA